MRYCDGSGSEPEPKAWRVGAAYTYAHTRIDFSFEGERADDTADFGKQGVSASLERRISERLSGQLSVGAVLDGQLDIADTSHDVNPGWLASLALSWRVLDPDPPLPFLLLTGSFGASGASTTERGVENASDVSLFSTDGRLGVAAGYTLGEMFSPYAMARAFGFPVLWELGGDEAVGEDHYHYQVGVGALVTLPHHFDLFVEGAFIGEKAIVAGAGYGF